MEVGTDLKLRTGKYWICDTKNGGTYKHFDPDAEQKKLSGSDTDSKGNTRALIRMMKKWQEQCCVPIKSFWLELLAIDFMSGWAYKDKSTVYYDWMVRDFLTYIVGRANGWLFVPGTSEMISLGDGWKSRAETARDRAIKACVFEGAQESTSAGLEWQKIFGSDIPA